MIYKRELRLRQIIKIREKSWSFIRADSQEWQAYNTKFHGPMRGFDDQPSCLLEVTLLRPELDYT